MSSIGSAKHQSVAMHRRTGLLLFALLSIGVAPQASFAQSNADVVRSRGLLGTWRLDCTRPASRTNPDFKYVVRDGKLFHDRDLGDKTDSAGRVAALELDLAEPGDLSSSRMTMHVNKVHHVTTITRVAEDLGEDEDWLRDVANEMKIEDGVIWVYGVGEDGVLAFTDFGIENLIELVRTYKQNPGLLRR